MDSKLLFLLGAGASIASSNPTLKKVLGALSIPNFLNVMYKMDEYDDIHLGKLMERKFDFKRCGDIFNLNNNHLNEIKTKLKNREDLNVSKIFTLLKQDIKEVLNREEKISFADLNFIELIFKTVCNYYQCFESKYFDQLYKIVKETNSTVISLNWDINFEKAIFIKERVDMKHYYGQTVYEHLKKNGLKFNPIVKILKPHGSLNQYFHGGQPGGYFGNVPESEYHLYVSNHINPDYNIESDFVLPPLEENEIAELNQNDNRMKVRKYGKRTIKIIKGIFQEIKDAIANSDTLIIIGYSFPPEDKHILDLFRNPQIKKLIVFDIDKTVFNRIGKYFPKSEKKFYVGFEKIFDFKV